MGERKRIFSLGIRFFQFCVGHGKNCTNYGLYWCTIGLKDAAQNLFQKGMGKLIM